MNTTITLTFFSIAMLSATPTWAELFDVETKLTASDAAAVDQFGWTVGIDNSTAIVGSPKDDDGGSDSGSAYLFDVTTGRELFKLTASDAADSDHFGRSVSIGGNRAIVAAEFDNDGGSESGSAYLFDVTTGRELFKLGATDAMEGDRFGSSVAISDYAAIVGAFGDDDGGFTSGSAYVFDVTTGMQLFKLTALDASRGDSLGASVAISGTTAIVAAPFDDDGGHASGSAYLFDVTTGNQIFKLTASDAAADDQFGISVAISGNTAIVGSRFDDDDGNVSGSAYLFDVTTGNELFKLTASDAAEGDLFGKSVGISGNTAIVGGIGGDDNRGVSTGSAYLFDVTTGSQLLKLNASDGALPDRFGASVAISGDTAIVGAFGDRDEGFTTGAAYLYTNVIPEPSCTLLAIFAGLCSLGATRFR